MSRIFPSIRQLLHRFAAVKAAGSYTIVHLRPSRQRLAAVLLMIVTASAGLEAAVTDNRNFQISKQFDIFHSIYRELEAFYVDSTDVNKVFDGVLQGLLSSYDPYTEYIPQDEMDDFKYLTTGGYAGIGALIAQRNGHIEVSEPYEGMPAQKAGVCFGDEIVSIDGEEMAGKDVSYASSKLRGEPNTEVRLVLRRQGEKKLLHKVLVRQLVQIDQVEYYGMVAPGIGYIYLSGFTDKASQEVRQALLSLQAQGADKLILDLRGNGGGVLSEAVNLCNLFLPKDQLILETRGRIPEWDHKYRTTREPLAPEMPLVVLVNSMSASASEIVAGAIQDLDRGVVIGTRTFGKGLVQTTRELPYDAMIKLTTAKYYIPSGRCIQAIDYSNRNDDGSVGRIPDSLTCEFHTRAGRLVRDGGGVLPDVEISLPDYSSLTYELAVGEYIFDYANRYYAAHPKAQPIDEFRITDADYADFKAFVMEKGVKYDLSSRRQIENLKTALEYDGYLDLVKDELSALEQKLEKDLAHDLDYFRSDIEQLLLSELVSRYYFRRGEIQVSLRDDEFTRRAIGVLSDETQYNSLLKPNKSEQ